MKRLIGCMGILLILTSWTSKDSSQLILRFEDIKYTHGVLLLGFYQDEESWKKRKPSFERIVEKYQLENGTLTVQLLDMTSGVYGIAVLDDANANNRVDFGFVFPKEGFGFSNYYHDKWILPSFENFDFNFPVENQITIKMRYL